jgi:PAS domain S-box-containing protein
MTEKATTSTAEMGFIGGLLSGLSIKRKLVLIIMIVSTLVIIFAGGSFVIYERHSFRQAMADDLSSLAEVIGNNCNAALSFDSPEDAADVLGSLHTSSHVLLACLHRVNGEVMTTYQRDESIIMETTTPPAGSGFQFKPTMLEAWHEILQNGKPVGSLYIRSDLEELDAFLNKRLLEGASMILLAFFIAYFLAERLQRTISVPVLALAGTASSIAESQDYSARAVKISEDELGMLTDAFNKMLSRVQSSNTSLVESNKRVQLLLDSTAEGIFGLDLDGNCTWCNPTSLKMLGYESLDQILHNNMHALIHHTRPDGSPYPDAECRVYRAFRENRGFHVDDEVFWRADGTCFPTEYWSFPIRHGDEAVGSVVTFLDITERLQAAESLQKSEEKYRLLVENVPYCIHQIDDQGRLISMNPAGLSMLEADDERDIKEVPYLDTVADEDKERVEHLLRSALAGKPSEFEFTATNNHIFASTFIPLPSADGSIIRLMGISQDITERRQAEEQRISLERQVQHAQKLESLGILAGGIAHDFNNLLMAILGNADLALDDLSPHAPARDNINEILKASKRAAELARQMLAYSGKGHFVIKAINLNEFVDEMAHLLKVSTSKKAVLKFNFADNLPTFNGDATQIRQVIMNLITNASEAIDDKSGIIALSTGAMDCDRAYLDGVNEVLRAGLDEPLQEGMYVYLEVADTGCGMDRATIDKIFDPFFTTKFTGRGLGMSALLGIVRGHHGAIRVYSEPGKGTTFKVLFPANQLTGDDESINAQLSGETGSSSPGYTGTVLITDDEETVCAVGKQMLSRMGFDVLTAADGREGVDVFHDHADEIVCVLLDLTMPHLDGDEAFREMRRIRPDVPVILCSGYNEQDATQRFAGKGLAGFLQKPYNMAALKEKLNEVLKA